jgi:hypothetical protein
MQTQEEESFAAFATFLGTPLPANPIKALRILRYEAAKEIERLITFLDALGGDPDLEDGGDAEPTLGWPASGRAFGTEDGELEPSLGWTGIINQSSRNRLGYGEDYEQDDADKEEGDEGEEAGDLEPSLGWETAFPGRMMVDGSASLPAQFQVMDPGFDQTSLSGFGSDIDIEGEHDGREPNGDEQDTSYADDEHYSVRR